MHSTLSAAPKSDAEADLVSDVVQQAADWHVRLQTVEDQQAHAAAFEQWLSQHPSHGEVYRRLDALWHQFELLHDKPARDAVTQVLTSDKKSNTKKSNGKLTSGKLSKKWLGKSALPGLLAVGLLLVGVMRFMLVNTEPGAYLLADYRSAIGEQRVIVLADRSRITLNTYSAIDVDYSDHQRRIVLRQGEILVEVAKNAARPFVVETSQGTARALGTKYLVRREGDTTTVSVLESKVEVCTAHQIEARATPHCLQLQAGQGVDFTIDQLHAPTTVDVDAVAAWKEGVLSVDNQPLSAVLNTLARYRIGHIDFNAAALEHIKVSGVFPLHNTDQSLTVLADTLPITVRTYTPLWVVVNAR